MRRKRRQTGIERLESRRVLTALVDIDSDGDLDFFESTKWYENTDGYGLFEEHSFARFADAAAGDLDGDGDPDIATNRGWFENGDESLRHLIDLPRGFVPTKVELQDAGADGDLDMIFFREDRAVLLLNDGSGAFEVGDDIVVERLADAADIDNDGDLDALVIRDGEVIVMSNNGQGDFDKTVRYRDRDPTPVELEFGWLYKVPTTIAAEFGHVDSDDILDVITVDGADALNNAWGHVTGGISEKVWTCWHCDILFDDIDLDGDIDIIQRTDAGTSLVSNRSDGDYEYLTGFSLFIEAYLAGGDINGDGIADVATKDGIWLDGATQFGRLPGMTVPGPDPRATTFIDQALPEYPTAKLAFFNADDNPDMLLNSSDSIGVMFGGSNISSVFYQLPDGHRVRVTRSGDVDDDGDNDIVFITDETVGWIENLGDQEFAPVQKIAWIDSPSDLAIGDVIGDSSIDIVVVGNGGFRLDAVTVFENTESTFAASSFSTDTLVSLDLADVDADGRLDIFAQTSNDRHVWWKNDNGVFRRKSLRRAEPVTGLMRLSFADVNGDGTTDMLTSSDRDLIWYDSIIGEKHTIATSVQPWTDVEVLDIDDDGDLDIVAAILNNDFSYRSNRLFSYTNIDGRATFSDAQWFGYAPDFTSIQVIDYDNDGDDDIATFGSGGRNVLFESRRSGDSNNDELVNSQDLIHVFQFGEYEDDVRRNSTFETGDWNGDQEFDSGDFVYLFSAKTYEAAARRQQVAAAMAVDRILSQAGDDETKSTKEWLPFVP